MKNINKIKLETIKLKRRILFSPSRYIFLVLSSLKDIKGLSLFLRVIIFDKISL